LHGQEFGIKGPLRAIYVSHIGLIEAASQKVSNFHIVLHFTFLPKSPYFQKFLSPNLVFPIVVFFELMYPNTKTVVLAATASFIVVRQTVDVFFPHLLNKKRKNEDSPEDQDEQQFSDPQIVSKFTTSTNCQHSNDTS
jgi:hypothetical protein